MEFFAKSETGLVPISALNRLHNGDSLLVIPVYDSVYAELLKVKPDTSPLMLQVEGLSEGLTSGIRGWRLESGDSADPDAALYGTADWITYALRTDEQGEVNMIIIFEDLDTEQIMPWRSRAPILTSRMFSILEKKNCAWLTSGNLSGRLLRIRPGSGGMERDWRANETKRNQPCASGCCWR